MVSKVDEGPLKLKGNGRGGREDAGLGIVFTMGKVDASETSKI